MKRILIADDEPQLRILVNATLKQEGFELMEAANGVEALAMAQLHKPDLLILDWMMPRMTGIEVANILNDSPETNGIPIIMLTAKGLERDREAGRIAGVRDYMIKPFSPKELRQLVHQMLETVAVG